jgi:hypothetical protein
MVPFDQSRGWRERWLCPFFVIPSMSRHETSVIFASASSDIHTMACSMS